MFEELKVYVETVYLVKTKKNYDRFLALDSFL